MTAQRHTASTITDNELDRLYAELDELGERFQNQAQAATELVDQLRTTEAARDGAYRERARLVAHLAALHPSTIGLTEPSAPDWAVVTIETPAGQMCWHIATDDYDLFEHVERSLDPVWDGHSTDEKYERLRQLAASVMPQPDKVLTFDRQLTDEEYEKLKAWWNRAHGGGRQNHAGPITTGPSAEEQLARFHEGEEPVTDEHVEATPGQWIWHWNRATPEERLDMAALIKDASARASACFIGGHEARLDEQQARITRLEADARSSDEAARRAMEQRQDMATERYALQERAKTAEERRDELAATLHHVLGHFTRKGHPGAPCLESGWVREDTVAKWRAVLWPPAIEEQKGCRCHNGDELCSGCRRCPDICNGCDGSEYGDAR